jgi:adenine phosphoribosyltransferase
MDSVPYLKGFVREIPNFPKPGILFYDITPLLQHPKPFRRAIHEMVHHFSDLRVDKVVSMESRGFIFGSVLAHELNAGFVPIRKPGKLPHATISEGFDLEYRANETLHMHTDAIVPNERVLIVDDVLATGGTAQATVRMVEKAKGKIVGMGFLIELTHLNGRKKLAPFDVFSLLKYDKG